MLQCLSNIVKCFFAIHQPQSKQSAVNHQAERGTTAHLIQNADGRPPTRSIPIMPRLSGPCKPCNEFCHFLIEIASSHKNISEVTLTKACEMRLTWHFPSVLKFFFDRSCLHFLDAETLLRKSMLFWFFVSFWLAGNKITFH